MTDTLAPIVLERRSPWFETATLAWPIVRELNAFAADEGASRSHVFHAALALVLRRFTGNDDLTVRVNAGGNAHAVRTAIADATSFREALRIVRDACEAERLETCSHDRIELSVTGGEACVLLGNVAGDELVLSLASEREGLERSTAAVLSALVSGLTAAVAAPDAAGNVLPLCDAIERQRLLWRADGPRRPRTAGVTLDRIVAERAAASPAAVAVVVDDARITYRELHERARAIAAHLLRLGVAPRARIGVCADPSTDLFAAILGIWSAGATYVPLDPALPRERLAMIAGDANIALALVDRDNVGAFDATKTVVLETVPAAYAADVPVRSSVSEVAYILYTSGSTGLPKGVAVSHRAAVNAILAASDVCGFSDRDSTLYRTAISFDLSIYDIFCSLANGGTIVVAPRKQLADPFTMIELIVKHGITHLLLGPSFLGVMVERHGFERCTSLRAVTAGGEALPLALCAKFFARSSATLYNLYGPSEAAMLVTLHRCHPSDLESREMSAPLGIPLANTHVSIRDAAFAPVVRGAIGEIMIGGTQLADGYINRPAETAAQFVADPARPGEGLYRTGDIARLCNDGSVVFLSRNDRQVKIRGSRVEPAEVAAAIERIEGVTAAVVCVQRRVVQDPSDAAVLVAYVKLRRNADLNGSDIRSTLRGSLPAYMIPIDVFAVDAFPLTVSGKIDEKALAAGNYAEVRAERAPASAPAEYSLRGIVREQIRMIWERLLNRSSIGDYDEFFDIGGDSLLAVRLMMELEETFGHRVAASELFDSMTIAALATLVAGEAFEDERDAIKFNENGTKPPFVYLHGDFAGGSYAWSLANLLASEQPLTVIPPHGIAGRPAATNVPAMAEDVIATIERLHPAGPLRIGGYSAAGLLAYEVACRLRERGRVVTDVVLVATSAGAGVLGPVDRLARLLPAPLRSAALERAVPLLMRALHIARMPASERKARLRRRSAEPATVLAANEIELGADYQRYERAHASYVPGSYAGDVTILWPAEEMPGDAHYDADWRRIAPAAQIVPIAGSHHGCVSRHLDWIAAEMRSRFG